MQAFHPGFAEAERRAGQLMLRLLGLEAQLSPRDHLVRARHSVHLGDDPDDEGQGDEGPRLSQAVVSLCDEICSTPRVDLAHAAKRRLQQLSGAQGLGLEEAVRCYKWAKLLCTWKYPEVAPAVAKEAGDDGASTRPDEFEFFGLRPSEGRMSVFLIRALHR